MDTSAYADTNTQKILLLKEKKRRKEETKIRHEQLTRSENSQTQILELKKKTPYQNSHHYINQKEHHHQLL